MCNPTATAQQTRHRESCVETAKHDRKHSKGYDSMFREPGEQMLYIGSYACIRHHFPDLAELQSKEKLAFLCPSGVDFITGGYLQKIQDAAAVLVQKRNATGLILVPGCQCTLLSTDFDLLADMITDELHVPVRVDGVCRLCAPKRDEQHGHGFACADAKAGDSSRHLDKDSPR